jgi:putative hydrolase of HD superfamily
MYRMAMLALALPAVPDMDMGKVMRMCLVHDFAETRIGDLTPVSTELFYFKNTDVRSF